MIPTIGRIVHYRLTAAQAEEINRRRVDARLRFERERADAAASGIRWSHGGQFHVGNTTHEGDAFPMLIVRTFGADVNACVNGQVFLDGNDVLWTNSVQVGLIPGTWMWPERAFERVPQPSPPGAGLPPDDPPALHFADPA